MTEYDRARVLRGRHRGEVARLVVDEFVCAPGTMAELARQFGRRPSLVRRLLEEAGLRADGVACVGIPAKQLAVMLAERYRAGVSIDSLAATTGLGRPVVRDLLLRGGVTVRPRNSVPADMSDWVVERYRAGATLRTLADESGCSYSTVRRHLLAAGVDLRPPGGMSRPSGGQ